MIKNVSLNKMKKRLMRGGVFFLLILTNYIAAIAQNETKHSFLLPVDIPVKLAANYGELRPNHFHGGIDFKTESVVGKNMIAIDSGYVSRVQIRPSGYGNALYITHPNGITSVYGHLLAFSPEIDSVVKAYQYTNQKNTVDASFEPNQLPVIRGEVVALSGNSGSSSGPHLHFEMRDSKTQNTLNPLQFYPQIVDKARPKISNIGVYALDSNSYVNNGREKIFYKAIPIVENPGMYSIASPVIVSGNIGFGIQGNDYMQNTGHIYGYYSVALLCNDTVLYERKIDEISFKNGADINSLIDYKEKLKTGRLFEKAYVDENNELEIYTTLVNNGIYATTSIDTAVCEFIVADYNGNIAAITITLLQKPIPDSIKKMLKPYPKKFSCKEGFDLKLDGCTFTTTNKTFFTDFTFASKVDTLNPKKRYFSKRYTISSDQLIFKNAAKISIQTTLPKELYDKALIECSNKAGAKSALVTKIDENGVATANVKKPGIYAVTIDTVAPHIKPNFVNNQNLSASKKLTFKMSDNFSGIKEYDAFVDDQWCILDFDAKSAIVNLRFDETRIEKGKTHTLRIRLEDMCGNVVEKNYTFVW